MSAGGSTVVQTAEEFARRGFACVDSVVPISEADLAYRTGISNFNEVLSVIEKRELEFGIGAKNGFAEIVQRHERRYEVPYKMDQILDQTNIFHLVSPYAYQILGPDAHVVNCSLVVSRPGSQKQSWHVDGPHLSPDSYLPCHCLNIFVSLLDMTPELGPTEFRPCSQFLTRDLSKMYMAAFVKKQLENVEAPLLRKGSILLFDYRTLHRGLANASDMDRPVFVLTFALPWFKDVLNFPPRSVLRSEEATDPTPRDGENIACGSGDRKNEVEIAQQN